MFQLLAFCTVEDCEICDLVEKEQNSCCILASGSLSVRRKANRRLMARGQKTTGRDKSIRQQLDSFVVEKQCSFSECILNVMSAGSPLRSEKNCSSFSVRMLARQLASISLCSLEFP